MADLTGNTIKNLLQDIMREATTSLRAEIKHMFREEAASTRTELRNMFSTETESTRTELKDIIRAELKDIRADLVDVKSDINVIKTVQGQQGIILQTTQVDVNNLKTSYRKQAQEVTRLGGLLEDFEHRFQATSELG